MAKRVIFYVPAPVAASLFNTRIQIGSTKWVRAAGDCID